MRFKITLATLFVILLLSACATTSATLPTPEDAESQGKQSVRLATMVWQDASSSAATLCNQGAISLADCQQAELHTETARVKLRQAAAYLDGDRTVFGTFEEHYRAAYGSIVALQNLVTRFGGE